MKNDMDTIILYAMRYTMGRMTYAVGDVAGVVKRQWGDLSDGTKIVMIRDLGEAVRRHEDWLEQREQNETSFAGPLGMDCDYAVWCDLYRFMVEHGS